MLDRKYPGKYEVISLAKGGFSTIDAFNVLNNLALNLSPDLIILAYYVNDAEGPGSRLGFESLFFQHYVLPYEFGEFLYSHSYMYYFIESRLNNMFNRFNSLTYEDYVLHLYSASNPFYEGHQEILADFINTSENSNVPVVVLNIPVINNFKNYPFRFVNK